MSKIPELFQEIIHNDKTRKELTQQEIVPLREYTSLRMMRSRYQVLTTSKQMLSLTRRNQNELTSTRSLSRHPEG